MFVCLFVLTQKEAKSQNIVANWVFTAIVILIIVGGMYWMLTKIFYARVEEPTVTLNTVQEFQRPLFISNEPSEFLQSVGVFKPPSPSSLTLN